MSYNNGFTGIARAAVICRGKTAQSINAWTTLTNWSEVQDPTNSFDPVPGIFAAPRAGLYHFSLGDSMSQAVGQYYGLSVTKNGTQFYNTLQTSQTAVPQYPNLSGIVELAANDLLLPRAYCAIAANDNTSISNSWWTVTELITNF